MTAEAINNAQPTMTRVVTFSTWKKMTSAAIVIKLAKAIFKTDCLSKLESAIRIYSTGASESKTTKKKKERDVRMLI